MPTLPLTHHALPGESQPQDLLAFIAAHRLQLAQDLLVHGAIRFRGYALATPQAVEDVALALDPQLAAGEYLGTSPRNALTRHVHSASELPGYYPIPQHCEMSFLAHPPTRLYLACLQPSRWGGEPRCAISAWCGAIWTRPCASACRGGACESCGITSARGRRGRWTRLP